MPADKYTAVWVSHSSLSDYLKCPRAYYLKNIYKDPKSGHKMKLMSPPLALGQAVHDVLESLYFLPAASRFKEPLMDKYEQSWKKVSGKNGGFVDADTEYRYKSRGAQMISQVASNPGPLLNPAVRINMDLPHYWLSEEDNIILCGKIDWLEYLADSDAVHIIDFKTSQREEDPNSLQLPIYCLLVHNCQKRIATKASYWYLELDSGLQEKVLPDLEESRSRVLKTAKQIKLARQLQHFKCPKGDDGCRECQPFEAILRGEAEFVGVDEYRCDVFISKKPVLVPETEDSIIL